MVSPDTGPFPDVRVMQTGSNVCRGVMNFTVKGGLACPEPNVSIGCVNNEELQFGAVCFFESTVNVNYVLQSVLSTAQPSSVSSFSVCSLRPLLPSLPRRAQTIRFLSVFTLQKTLLSPLLPRKRFTFPPLV